VDGRHATEICPELTPLWAKGGSALSPVKKPETNHRAAAYLARQRKLKSYT